MEVLVGVIIAILMTMVMHWFPWRPLLGRDLPRVCSYLAGVVFILTPPSILLLLWYFRNSAYFHSLSAFDALAIVWFHALAVGVTTAIIHFLDNFLTMHARVITAEEDGRVLRRSLTRDGQDS